MIPVWLTDSVTTDLARALHYTQLWGLDGIELRAMGHAADRVPFINEGKLRRRFGETDLVLAAAAPALFEAPVSEHASLLNDLEVLKESVGFCRRHGVPILVASCFQSTPGSSMRDAQDVAVDALRRAASLLDGGPVTLAVLNERGSLAPTGEALRSILERVGAPSVKAAWNPVEALLQGEDIDEAVRHLGSRVALVRVRNGRRSGASWTETGLEEGEIDWSNQLYGLLDAGFEGPLSLEVNGPDAPKRGLHDATFLIRLIRKARKR